jgi:hypothetical protein
MEVKEAFAILHGVIPRAVCSRGRTEPGCGGAWAFIHDAADSINSRPWARPVSPDGMETRSSFLSRPDMVDELLTIIDKEPGERLKDQLIFEDSGFPR